jgi:uncharacterized protein DUF397
LTWKKSSFTTQENCVEVAHLGHAFGVRDSKDPDGPVLTVSSASLLGAASVIPVDLAGARRPGAV